MCAGVPRLPHVLLTPNRLAVHPFVILANLQVRSKLRDPRRRPVLDRGVRSVLRPGVPAGLEQDGRQTVPEDVRCWHPFIYFPEFVLGWIALRYEPMWHHVLVCAGGALLVTLRIQWRADLCLHLQCCDRSGASGSATSSVRISTVLAHVSYTNLPGVQSRRLTRSYASLAIALGGWVVVVVVFVVDFLAPVQTTRRTTSRPHASPSAPMSPSTTSGTPTSHSTRRPSPPAGPRVPCAAVSISTRSPLPYQPCCHPLPIPCRHGIIATSRHYRAIATPRS